MVATLNNIAVTGTFMLTEKAMIHDHLRVSKVSWKFRIPTIHTFAIIYP